MGDLVNTIKHEWNPCLRRAGANDTDCAAISRAFIYDGFFFPGERN